METYVLLLTIVPVVFSLLFLFGRKQGYYKAVSGILAAIAALLSILLVLKGEQQFTVSGTAYHITETIIMLCEAIITLYIFWIAIKHKRWMVLGLSVVSTCLSLYSVIFLGGAESALVNADKLSLVMSLIINIVGTMILLFSNGYMKHYEEHRGMKSKQKLFYFMICIFLSAMNGLVYSDSLSWMYFFWEVTTISSFVLISYNGDNEALDSGFRALLLNLIGGICFLAGNILFKSTLGIDSLSQVIHSGQLSSIYVIPVFLLCIAGFAKSAQMPFQSWLLGAMVAPTPISALLHSSTMVKAGVYLIVKLSPAYAGTNLGLAIAIYGGISFLLCSAIAVTQRNAKRVLAYSTIANLGLIISSAGMGTPIAVSAAIMLIIFHAVSKALLFLCAGQIEHVIGSRDIEDMTGLIRKAPLLTVITGFGILSMILPPFGVLVTKWISIEASAVNPVVMILLVLGSALTSVFWIKWLGTLLSYPVDNVKIENRVNFVTYFPLGILCAAILGTSLFITPIFNKFVSPEITRLLNLQNDLSGSYGNVTSSIGSFNVAVVFIVLALIAVVYVLIRKFVLSANIKKVYLCGENSGDSGSSPSFRSGNGVSASPVVANLYLQNVISENKITIAGTILSILVIAAVLAGGLL